MRRVQERIANYLVTRLLEREMATREEPPGRLEVRIGGLLQGLARLRNGLVERRHELRGRVQWSCFVIRSVLRRDIQLVQRDGPCRPTMECWRPDPTSSRAPSTSREASNRACPMAPVRARAATWPPRCRALPETIQSWSCRTSKHRRSHDHPFTASNGAVPHTQSGTSGSRRSDDSQLALQDASSRTARSSRARRSGSRKQSISTIFRRVHRGDRSRAGCCLRDRLHELRNRRRSRARRLGTGSQFWQRGTRRRGAANRHCPGSQQSGIRHRGRNRPDSCGVSQPPN